MKQVADCNVSKSDNVTTLFKNPASWSIRYMPTVRLRARAPISGKSKKGMVLDRRVEHK
jgi:hypothetical protein